MVSLSTEICQNFNRFSLPSLYHKERIILLFFFLFLFNAVHRIISTDIRQLLFYGWKLNCILFLGHKIRVLQVLPHKHLRQVLPNTLWTLCIYCLMINGCQLKDKIRNSFQILILANSQNQMIVLHQNRKRNFSGTTLSNL